MKPEKLLLELEELIDEIGYTIRREKGAFRSDSCVMEGQKLIVLNKRQPAESQISVLTRVLEKNLTDDIYVKPAVRKDIDEYLARQPRLDEDDDVDSQPD